MNLKARKTIDEYHQKLYEKNKLYEKGSWLEKPEPEIAELIDRLRYLYKSNILDLGSGVGRNVIPLAQALSNNNPRIICVDYLKTATNQLRVYSKKHNVDQFIFPIHSKVEDYEIEKNHFDLIIAHGILVYLENEKKLNETIRNMIQGTKTNGFNYLSINADIKQQHLNTKKEMKTVLEIKLNSDEVISMMKDFYKDWKILMLKKNPFKELYEKNGKMIQYYCNFVVCIAQKI